jgi:hypothetical protein
LQDIEFHEIRMRNIFGKNWNAEPTTPKIAEDAGEAVSLIYLDADDCRGPLVLDGPEDSDPLEKFHREIQEERLANLAKGTGGPSISTVTPSLDEVIGWSDEMEFEKVEHIEVSPSEMTLAKRDLRKASSGPGRVRLEKMPIDGEVWLFGFDSNGEEVFSRPFVERQDAA